MPAPAQRWQQPTFGTWQATLWRTTTARNHSFAVIEGNLATLTPGEADYAIVAAAVEQGKAVVAACERAQRIERIADLQESIASSENIEAIVASGDMPLA